MAKYSASAPSSPRGGKHKNSSDKTVDNSLISEALRKASHKNKILENIDGHYVLSPVHNERDLKEYMLVPVPAPKSGHKRSDSGNLSSQQIKRQSKIYNKSPLPEAKSPISKELKLEQSPQENKIVGEKKYGNFELPSFSAKSILTKPGKNKEEKTKINPIQKIDTDSEEFNQQNLNKNLFEAAKKGRYEDIKNLVNLGADINCADQNGDTPLILAITSKNYATVGILLKFGADIKQINKAGQSALDKADDHFKMTYYIITANTKSLKDEFCKQIITVSQQNEQQNYEIETLKIELRKLEIMLIKDTPIREALATKVKETNLKNRELITENQKLREKVIESEEIVKKNINLSPDPLSANKQTKLEDETSALRVQLYKLVEQIHDIQKFLFKTDPNYEEVVAVDGSTIIVQPTGECGH